LDLATLWATLAAVIVSCPNCKTAHSKTDRELAVTPQIACRSCGQVFKLGASGKTELVPGAVATPAGAPAPSGAASSSAIGGTGSSSAPRPAGLASKPADATVPSLKPAGASVPVAPRPSAAATPLRPDATVPAAHVAAALPSLKPGAPAAKPLGTTTPRATAPAEPWKPMAGKPGAATAPSPGGLTTSPVLKPFGAATPLGAAAPRGTAPAEPFSALGNAPVATAVAAPPGTSHGPSDGTPTVEMAVPVDLSEDISLSAVETFEGVTNGNVTADAPKADGQSGTPTGSINADRLHQKLEQMRAEGVEGMGADTAAETSSSDSEDGGRFDLPGATGASATRGFPSADGKRFVQLVWAWAKSRSLAIKAALGGGLALVLAGIVLLAVLSSRSGVRQAFVIDAQPLFAGPMAGDAYPQLATKQRGDRVELYGTFGEFSLVRDTVGRAGYVLTRGLRDAPPPSVPGQAFADCERAPIEASSERCQHRAQEQFDSCRKACSSLSEEPSCLEHCQQRFANCATTCEGRAAAAGLLRNEAPPPAALPAAAVAPILAPTPSVSQEPSETTPAPSRKGKKSKKGLGKKSKKGR